MLATPGFAQPRLPASADLAIDGFLGDTLTETGIPGLVALVTSVDDTLYSGAFGLEDVARGKVMREDAVFRIASMTKPVTAVAVMMLVEEGRLELDDPVDEHLPGVVPTEVFASFDPATRRYTSRPAKSAVTIRQLLTHTSGLGYPWADATLFALLGSMQPSPTVTSVPLLFDPGTRWTYGESTRVLGTLIERLTGQTLETFYAARIFVPLGMTDTGWTVPDAKRERLVTAHNRTADGLVESPNVPGPIGGAARGDGGLYSTAPDYAKFLRMLLGGGVAADGTRLLSAESVRLIGRNHIGTLTVELQDVADTSRSRPFPVGAGRDTFGLAVQVTGEHDDPELRAPGSFGWAGIMNTQFWVDPSRGIGAILLMQYLPFYDDTAIATLEGFERQVYRHLEE
jgi:CubicO group peptidase (beta-lactamase class C family)